MSSWINFCGCTDKGLLPQVYQDDYGFHRCAECKRLIENAYKQRYGTTIDSTTLPNLISKQRIVVSTPKELNDALTGNVWRHCPSCHNGFKVKNMVDYQEELYCKMCFSLEVERDG